jgi:hypothetical protein
LNFHAVLPFLGVIAAANAHTSFGSNARSSTRFTFVSTVGTGFSYAKHATAPAVYRPTPGSF